MAYTSSNRLRAT